MTTLCILSLIVSVILGVKSYTLWLKVDELNDILGQAVLLLRAREQDIKKLSAPASDDQINKLIRLAVNSASSEGEARNAAMQVCKKLSQKL